MQRRYRLAVVVGLVVVLGVVPVYPVTREECNAYVVPGEDDDCSNALVLHPTATVVSQGFEYDARDLGRSVMDATVTYDASPATLASLATLPLVTWIALGKVAAESS